MISLFNVRTRSSTTGGSSNVLFTPGHFLLRYVLVLGYISSSNPREWKGIISMGVSPDGEMQDQNYEIFNKIDSMKKTVAMESDPFMFTSQPITKPSSSPSFIPTANPSPSPSPQPTLPPSDNPTVKPTSQPTSQSESSGYFNYDPNSLHGPGQLALQDILVRTKKYGEFTYSMGYYRNNGWGLVTNSPEEIYWREYFENSGIFSTSVSPESENETNRTKPTSPSPPSDKVPKLRNMCALIGSRWQSPINIFEGGAKCLEHHEIRTRPGDFALTEDQYVKKQILPNKLRFVYWRRPSPEVKEPDPPNSDFPHNWRGRTDVLHIDIKIPSEHYLNMKRYDAEYQIFHYNRYRKRIVVMSILMEVDEENDEVNEHWQKALDSLQEKFDYDQAQCDLLKERKLKTEKDNSNILTEDMNNYIRKDEQNNNSSNLNEPREGNNSKANKLRRSKTEEKELSPNLNSLGTTKDGRKSSSQVEKQFKKTSNLRSLENEIIIDGDDDDRFDYYDGDDAYSEPEDIKDEEDVTAPGKWNPFHPSLQRSIYFYGYKGSLTEPPCTEQVFWNIMDKPAYISKGQLVQMKRLLFDHVNEKCERTNAQWKGSVSRPLQDLMGRPVWHCTRDNFRSDEERAKEKRVAAEQNNSNA